MILERNFQPKVTNNTAHGNTPLVVYNHPNGSLYRGDAIAWMKSLPSHSVDLIFADPPYNIKKAVWDEFESHQDYVEWSVKWIAEASRLLKDSGSLYVCGFSEILADIKAPAMPFFHGCRWIVWHYKNKANLGNDWARSHESILHFRTSKNFTFNIDSVRIPYSEHTLKYAEHSQADTSQYGKGKGGHWVPNPLGVKPKDVIEVPPTCNGMNEKTLHPTQKPEELLRRIVLSSSNEGDVVLDFFLGSGKTAVTAEQLNRKWCGCDLSQEYLEWAIARIEAVEARSIEEWRQHDEGNLKRRNSIR